MQVIAPGKMLLTGAYAVLHGAPAIVIAVNRYARAYGEDSETCDAPIVNTDALYDGRKKLGLGSSAAVVVASLGVRAAQKGHDLKASPTRDAIFCAAREAHSKAQGGGSGVDVAASTYGGVLAYRLRKERADITAVILPQGAVIEAYWCGESARTRDLRAQVDAFKMRDPARHTECMTSLTAAAEAGLRAVETGNLHSLIDATRATQMALQGLGRATKVAIVPPNFAELARAAERENAAFWPAGAGGGDIGVFLGSAPPSGSFQREASLLALRPLSIALDAGGVRVETIRVSP